MRISSAVVLICCLFALLQQQHVYMVSGACPPGMYLTGLSVHCEACLPGYYCDNDEMTQCGPGTFTNQYGQYGCDTCPRGYITNQKHTECLPCNSKTNDAMTICLLPNTPQNAREIIAGQSLLTNITEGESNYYFQRIKFGYASSSDSIVTVQLTFTTQINKRLMIFASKLTGMPGKENYQLMGHGMNTTLGIQGKAFTQDMYYFQVIVMESIPRIGGLYVMDFPTIIDSNRPSMKLGQNLVSLTENAETIIEFKNTIQNNQLQFNIQVSDASVEVYYSANPDVEYPNPNNSVFVSANSNSVSFQARNLPIGLVRVAINKKENNGKAIVNISQK